MDKRRAKHKPTRFAELKHVFETLHGAKGCLWDKQQTHKSLIPCLKEEVKEFIDAVNKDDYENMKEEIGDILLLVMFHSQIAAKKKKFDIEDVVAELINKLIRRHPHVFSDVRVKSTRGIIRNWNKIKRSEKNKK